MRHPTGWTLAAADAQPWVDAPVDKLFNAESVPIRVPLAQTSQRVDLFTSLGVDWGSCPVDQQDMQPSAAAAGADGAAAEALFPLDSVLFAGGPVWALDWCPAPTASDAAAGPLQTLETLAVAAHPKDARRNPTNVAQQGPGAVQVWGVPSSNASKVLPGGLPKLLALLWHEGRLAWDIKWCPDPSPYITTSSNSTGSSGSAPVPLQGLLAACLANGDVVVWAVPTVQYLLECAEQQQQQQLQQQEDQQEQVLSLQLPYVWQMASAAVGGSLCSCCSWLPSHPHNKLLVGCWDGNVVVWQLSVGAQGRASAAPVQMLAADSTPIRAIAWQPNNRWWFTGSPEQLQAAKEQHQQPQQQQQQQQQRPQAAAAGHISSSSSSRSSQLFITGSSLGNIKVWDVHDVLQACQERMVTRHAVNAALWLGPPHVWVAACADGFIRTFWVDAGVQATGIAQQNADVSGSCGNVWALSASVPMSVVAYVSDGGLLGLMPLEPATGEPRHRKSHAALSGMAVAEDQLWLLRAQEIPGNGGLYFNVGKEPGAAARRAETDQVVVDPLPHPDQVLYAVAFSPNYRGLAMLAAGGGAGLVRLHAVSAEVVPVGW